MDIRGFFVPSGSNSHSANSSNSKRKGSDAGMLHSPVAAAEKEILSGPGQRFPLVGYDGEKCDVDLAAAGLQRT